MSRLARCKEPDCLGMVSITTNGMGGTVETCDACERRRRHFADVLARLEQRRKCDVCDVTIPDKHYNGKKTYCKACQRLARKRYALRNKDKHRKPMKVVA